MTSVAQALWLAGFAVLVAALVRATAAARARPRDAVGRVRVLLFAAWVGALGLGAVWVWSGAQVREGRDRIEAGGGAQADAPARARLFLRAVQLVVPLVERDPGAAAQAPAAKTAPAAGATTATAPSPAVATLGYSPGADLRLPRRYGLDETRRGWDLLEASAFGPRGLRVGVRAPPEATTTRVALAAYPGAAIASADDLGRLADRLVTRGGRCRPRDATSQSLGDEGTGAIVAVLCRDQRAVAALAFERDLGARPAGGAAAPATVALRVTPLTWSRRGFVSEHEQLTAGTLLQIGALADAVPGITLWEVPAPRGRAELFFPPSDVLARCDAWLARRGPILPTAPDRTSLPVDPTVQPETGSICVLPFSPPFALEVRRLVPDVAGVDERGTWAAALLVAPALLGLLLLAAGPASSLTRARLARALALAWLGVLVTALGLWRLLWAHRLDMMRDYQAAGERVIQNQVLLVLVAATLAAWTALAMFDGDRRHRAGAALTAALAWGATLALGALALRGDRALVLASRGPVAQAILSLGLGLAPAISAAAVAAGAGRIRAPGFLTARGLVTDDELPAARLVALGLAIAAAALAGDRLFPGAVAIKLPLAWGVILLGYAALRAWLSAARGRLAWRAAAVAAALVAAAAMLTYDAGVTAALVGPGLPIALVFASHDAVFDDRRLGRLRSFELRHAPLVRRHAALLSVLAVAIVAWALAGGGDDLAPAMTHGALRAPLVLAALVLVVAHHRWQHAEPADRGRAIAPWLAVAALLCVGWAASGPLIDWITDSDSRHASRLSIVVDPGYALLRDERDFLSGLTAWRETILPSGAGSLASGQGYFGAQVVDPGVRSAIEGDYVPVLFLRETGWLGLLAVAVLLLTTCAGLWLVAGERFLHGSAAQRNRALAAAVLGALCVYQPLASLGVLPLTGISWPGLGLNSPSDFWLLVALCGWVLTLGTGAADQLAGPAREADEPRAHDADLRATRVFRRTRRIAALAAAAITLAGLAVIYRGAVFALARPSPVDDDGQVTRGFAGLGRAVDYAYKLQCPHASQAAARADALVPASILGAPLDDTTQRFHDQLGAAWRTARPAAVAELDRFLADPRGATCKADRGGWRFRRGEVDGTPTCRATFSWGWPEVAIDVRAPDKAAPTAAAAAEAVATCAVDLPGDALRALRRPERRPYRGTRVRLVAQPMGAAALDRGELVAGHVTVRLRPGAGFVDVSRARAGVFAADSVQLSDELKVELAGDALRASGVAWTFVKNPPRNRVQVLEADPSGWRLVEPPAEGQAATVEVPLTSMSVLVVGARDGRNLWLYRPPRAPGEPVDILLADDVRTTAQAGRGARRRHYVFGGDLPELGWTTTDPSMAFGLDGWVQAALGEIERGVGPDRSTWRDALGEHATCGTLAPMPGTATGTGTATGSGSGSGTGTATGSVEGIDPRVCTRSPFDGVLECRISMQPELAIALRHLTELIAADPGGWTRVDDATPATEAQYVLLRGDTGELVAQGEFVPGRASTAYAPATPELEQHLMWLLEDRDPATGALRGGPPREDSAEKIEWNNPIAVGSTLKPLMARAIELAAPDWAPRLTLRHGAAVPCGDGRRRTMLGHCPPTPLAPAGSVEQLDLHDFLARSSNWYMAALGILGTALPEGEVRAGGAPIELRDAIDGDTGRRAVEDPITTVSGGVEVVGEKRVQLAALRDTPLWSRFEAIVGRTLCTDGDKRLCTLRGARRDLCAARALPIGAPTARQRHLVALGADRFDLYGEQAGPGAARDSDYFQFLRGSGLHPVGSLAQLADAFGRVVYDEPDAQGRFDLAASWFPVAPAAGLPDWDCRTGAHEPAVRGGGGGLCGSVRTGTSRAALARILGDDRFVVYGAKTGTIDALGDIAEDPARCARWNRAHTVAGGGRSQPYHLACGQPVPDDGLFLIAFGVRTPDGSIVPFTLGLRFERVGKTAATWAAPHYLTAIAAYVNGSWSAAPAASPSSSASSSPPASSPPASPTPAPPPATRAR